MRCLRFLCVALLLTLVYSAVEFTFAGVAALEHASPAFYERLVTIDCVHALTLLLISTISTQQIFLYLPTVALGRNTLFAGATETFMTRSRTSMLSAWHNFIAHLAATPTRIVIGIRASFCHFVFTAEADLGRTHMCAGRARSSMASKLTRMWAFPGSLPATGLTT